MPDDDIDAFATFYDDLLPKIYRYVRYRVHDTATAEDLTSTIFEKALRAWHKRRRNNVLEPWIFRIARNTVVSHYRRNGRRDEVALDAVPEPSADAEKLDPEAHLLHTERWRSIQAAIQRLSRREQHIIALKFGSDLTNRAIAPIVGISENNVAVILHRTLRKILTHLESE